MAHKIQSVVCVDVETGGLDCTANPICSVSMKSFSLFDGKMISKYDAFVQPYANLQYVDAALKYNGITMQQLMKGKPIKQVVAEMCDQFTIANVARITTKKPALMGHNILFDIGFIQFAFILCKVDMSKILDCKKDGWGNMQPASYDTMWLSRMKHGADLTMANFKLETCCEKNGVALTDAHDASNDVAATTDLFLTFMNNLRSGGTELGQEVTRERKRAHFNL